ncbi:transposase [Chroococcidiopsis sp. CCMEE 29]|uniref:RNA-guided endonuclease InsQ/TnpB family protein n=1 Tax=Chroococcidiopsis sp. CCMEE 29 TaxID=155894 RepID=UPI00202248A1|nr:transposase [Chroococcidiopsis sp. CCMEE 29]
MIVLETKLKSTNEQYGRLDEAIRTAQFVRNSCIRYWMDNQNVGKGDLSKLCAVLAKKFEFAGKLNSMARQASAERAWQSIARFYNNCKKKKPGKKGFPRFKKNTRSVEYKTSGWKLSDDRKSITFTDGFAAGTFEMWGTRDLNFYQISQIKRIRVVRRADGYYAQFCVDVDREIEHEYTGSIVGIDLGLELFYTDSDGQTVANPRRLRKSEKRLKRLQKKVSLKNKGSKNRTKAINTMARQHLKVSRQRKDFAVKTAGALVASYDLIAYENLQVRNLVKNHKLAKSISDASWSMFIEWVEYFAKLHKIVTVAVPPQYTSQDCSGCGHRVQKTLSERTHQCLKCGLKIHRDHNAAQNILVKGLEVLGVEKSTGGQPETHAWGENHLWLVEGNFGWLSGLVEPGNPRGDSMESPTAFGTPNQWWEGVNKPLQCY